MKFTIKDRLQFSQRIDEGNGYIDTIIKNSLKDKLSISIEEIDSFNIREAKDGISWDNPTYVKDIELLGPELKILKGIVEVMEEKDEIDFSNIDICSEIMG